MTSELDAIYRQLREVATVSYSGRCAAILVSPFAVKGAITAMVASPERQRLLRGSVDPDLTVRDLYEVYVHPVDWDELLKSQRIAELVGPTKEITKLFGVPVVVEV
jgi:hypothetical protein